MLLSFYFRCFLDILWGLHQFASMLTLQLGKSPVARLKSHVTHVTHVTQRQIGGDGEFGSCRMRHKRGEHFTLCRSLQHLSHSALATCNIFSTATKHCRNRLDDKQDKRDKQETVLTIGCHGVRTAVRPTVRNFSPKLHKLQHLKGPYNGHSRFKMLALTSLCPTSKRASILAQVLQSYRVLLYPEGFLVLLTSCPTMSSETRTLPHRLIISRAFKLVDDSHTRVACKKHGQSSDSASVELASMLCVNRGSSSGHSSGCKSALPDVALKS
jgi:hypothetical protein